MAITAINETLFTNQHSFILQKNLTGIAIGGGTYTGTPKPSAFDYRLIDNSDSSTVQINGNDWNTATDLVFVGDEFTCTLPNIPRSTSYYRYELRDASLITDSAESSNTFRIAVKAGCIGQSNMDNAFGTTTTDTPSPYAYQYSPSLGSAVTPTGAGGIELANKLVSIFGCWAEIHEFAVGATSLADWTSPSTEYDDFVASTSTRADNVLNFIVKYQGESDGVNSFTVAERAAAANVFDAQIRADITGPDSSILPILTILIGKWGQPTDSENWSNINEGEKQNADADPNDYYLSALPATMFDWAHIDADGHIQMMSRTANMIGHIYGLTSYGFHPSIDYSVIINSTTTDVHLNHDGGTDFTPTTGIDSFTVETVESGRLAATGVRVSGNVVRLTHAAGTVTNVEALWGRLPDTANILRDNTALQLPIIQTYTSTVANIPTIEITGPTSSAVYNTSNPSLNISGLTALVGGTIVNVSCENTTTAEEVSCSVTLV